MSPFQWIWYLHRFINLFIGQELCKTPHKKYFFFFSFSVFWLKKLQYYYIYQLISNFMIEINWGGKIVKSKSNEEVKSKLKRELLMTRMKFLLIDRYLSILPYLHLLTIHSIMKDITVQIWAKYILWMPARSFIVSK